MKVAQTDVSRAFAALEAQADPSVLPRLRQRLAQEILKANFGKLSEVLPHLTSNSERAGVVSLAVSFGIKLDRARTLEAIEESLTGTERSSAMASAIRELTRQRELHAAVAVLEKMPASWDRNNSVSAIAGSFAKQDIDGVLEWIDSLDSTARPRAVTAAQNALHVIKDQSALLKLLPKLEKPADRQRAIRDIIALDVERGEAAKVREFVTSLPPQEQEVARQGIILADRSLTFDQSIAQVATLKPELVGHVVQQLVSREFQNDSHRAAALVLSVPENVRGSAVAALMSQWLLTDRGQLMAWIYSLPSAEQRDSLLQSLVRRLDKRGADLILAEEAISAISNPVSREKVAGEYTVPRVSPKRNAAQAR
ncbi:MAG: hypothetical protein M3463_13345 [Verrucomicrobiota bacterium]|nr:hypothetical protein [Verrucomicrobiota bacterium]